ncbi:MAG: glycosyltransferase [Desulfobacterales bacterium]|nr:glycosyltransferase [Desulfobacterales bacterium]
MNGSVNLGLVSVVVASYNHAEFLEQRMESLIGQTYQNMEILVIDDRSTDNSVEVLTKYQSHPKVKLIVRETNGGWVTVSNQGIDMSSGEFVIFANCDDDCDLRMIESLVEAMTSHPLIGIAFCRSLLVDEHDRVIGNDYAGRERSFRARCATDTLITGAEMSRFLLHSCVIPNLSAALIRKECFNTVGNLSSAYRACCDWDLFFRVVGRYNVAYVSATLNKFRQHKTTIRSIMKDRETYEEYFRLLLNQIVVLDLSFSERCRFRTHVMFLWAVHLLSPSWAGLKNFLYHIGIVIRHDPSALLFLGPGLILRVAQVFRKVALGLTRYVN